MTPGCSPERAEIAAALAPAAPKCAAADPSAGRACGHPNHHEARFPHGPWARQSPASNTLTAAYDAGWGRCVLEGSGPYGFGLDVRSPGPGREDGGPLPHGKMADSSPAVWGRRARAPIARLIAAPSREFRVVACVTSVDRTSFIAISPVRSVIMSSPTW